MTDKPDTARKSRVCLYSDTQDVLYAVMDPRAQLYSRQQIVTLTGVDDSTINYWTREGVLRATSGGGGKGQHRRFPFAEVNMAALLGELKKFGGTISELRKLAARFHDAMDYMASIGVDRINFEEFDAALRIRDSIEENGYVTHWIDRSRHAQYEAHAPWMLDLEQHALSGRNSYYEVHLTLEQNEIFGSVAHLIFGRETPDFSAGFPQLYKRALSIDRAEFDRHQQYWSLVTRLPTRNPGEGYLTSPDFFYKGADGDWLTVADPAVAGVTAVSYIGVDLERLSNRMWGAPVADVEANA